MFLRKVRAALYDAYGGPEVAFMAPDGFEAGPTDHGNYRIASWGRHASNRYPTWSRIPWGTALKEEKGELVVKYKGHWQPLGNVANVSKDEIMDYHDSLYGVRMVPPTWVFNDFGHATCYLYKDKNKNRRRDPGEKIHGEFIHTTVANEAQDRLGQEVVLEPSHGCIHLKPADLDEMMKRGFLRKNTLVVVHRYSDRKVIFPNIGHAAPPYELHFFPAMKEMLVIGTAK